MIYLPSKEWFLYLQFSVLTKLFSLSFTTQIQRYMNSRTTFCVTYKDPLSLYVVLRLTDYLCPHFRSTGLSSQTSSHRNLSNQTLNLSFSLQISFLKVTSVSRLRFDFFRVLYYLFTTLYFRSKISSNNYSSHSFSQFSSPISKFLFKNTNKIPPFLFSYEHLLLSIFLC